MTDTKTVEQQAKDWLYKMEQEIRFLTKLHAAGVLALAELVQDKGKKMTEEKT